MQTQETDGFLWLSAYSRYLYTSCGFQPYGFKNYSCISGSLILRNNCSVHWCWDLILRNPRYDRNPVFLKISVDHYRYASKHRKSGNVMTGTSLSCIRLLGLVFWNLIHLEVASDSFCFLWNCSWLLVFILYVFFMIFSGFNLYCWNGIHFS